MIDLNEMAARAHEAVKQRKANGADVSTDAVGSLKHCAGEVVEAVDAYFWWLSQKDGDGGYPKLKLSYELADIITCTLVAAEAAGVDIEAALTYVIARNEDRAHGAGDKL